MNIIHTAIKIFIVGIIAGLIAYLLGIKQYVSTGIIGILSLSGTTKDSIDLGIKRFLIGMVAIIASWALFSVFGYQTYVLIVFLIVFVPIALITDTSIGIVPGLVLTSQIYELGEFTYLLFLQQVGVIFIAILIAWLVNFLYPKYWMKELVINLKKIDEMLRDQLYSLSLLLKRKDFAGDIASYISKVTKNVNSKIIEVELNNKNFVLQNDHRYLAYVYMRQGQFNLVNKMFESANKIKETHKNSFIISDFVLKLIDSIGSENKANDLMNEMKQILRSFELEELPKNRVEFETRAMLFQIITDLEIFLEEKIKFHQKYELFSID